MLPSIKYSPRCHTVLNIKAPPLLPKARSTDGVSRVLHPAVHSPSAPQDPTAGEVKGEREKNLFRNNKEQEQGQKNNGARAEKGYLKHSAFSQLPPMWVWKRFSRMQMHKFSIRCLETLTFKLKAMNQFIFYQIISELFKLYFILYFTSTLYKFSWTRRCKFFLPFVWPFSVRFIRQHEKKKSLELCVPHELLSPSTETQEWGHVLQQCLLNIQ